MTPARYSRTAIALHWGIALLLVYNFALGQRTETLPRGAELFAAFQLHKSIGITVLLLSLWRLWIRLRTPRPAPIGDAAWAKTLSNAVHWAFYFIMIAIPISGWVIVSTSKSGIPTLLYGLIPWPHLPVSGEALHEAAEGAHGVMANAMLVLILLHLAGVIRHQFVQKDGLLDRMAPVSRAGVGTLLLLVASIIGTMALGRAGPLPSGGAAPAPVAVAPANSVEIAPPPVANTTAPVVEDKPEQADADLLETSAKGPVPVWNVTPGGRIGFTAVVSGETIQGRFDRWDAAIRFDPARLDQSNIRASVDLASVASGDAERDRMLGGDDFFGSGSPKAVFTASDIRSRGGDAYEARGMLRMKGVSQPLRLAFTLQIKGDTARTQGSARLDRRKFGVGSGQFESTDTIGADVNIALSFAAKRKASA